MGGTLTVPNNGLNLSGTVTITASWSPTPIKISLFIDSILVDAKTTNPATFSLDTTKFLDGAHLLRAVASLKNGRTDERHLNITIRNVVSLPPPPPPSPPPSGWPASFTTGPLGTNNVLPATIDGAILGAQAGIQGVGMQAGRDFVQQRIADMGRRYDVIHAFGNPNGNYWTGLAGWEDWVHSLGAVPMITIQGLSPAMTLANINGGQLDGAYAACAGFLKTKPFRVMVRILHEFNGNWFPWSVPGGSLNGNVTSTSAQFISAYRRIVNLFKQNGASNVGFIWSPSEGQDRAMRDNCYPGDTYVDWVSPDGYNLNAGDVAWSTPLHNGWAEFWEVFAYTGQTPGSTYSVYSTIKPFIPAEFSSKYDSGNVNRKANLFRNIATDKPTHMDKLRGIIFFDMDVWLYESQTWRVDEKDDRTIDAVTYQGFKDFANNADWKVGVQGGAT